MAKKLTIQEIEHLAIEQLKVGHAVLFLGPAGVGKTETAHRIAQELGLNDVYILNASQFSKEDLVVPARSTKNDETLDILTHDLDNKLILLDELTNANRSLMSALLSLVLEHRIGTKHFQNLHIIATGNRGEESTLAAPLPRPLMDRFAVFDFPVPRVDEWIDYMLTHRPEDSHGYYLNFLSRTGATDIFYREETDGEVSDYIPRPEPRSHSRVSALLKRFYPTREAVVAHVDKVRAHIHALAGPDVASKFLGFIQDERNHLPYSEFIAGRMPENATQYMHLILDAATVLRPTTPLTIDNRKGIEDYAEQVVEGLNGIIDAGLESSELRRLATLAPRYIFGLNRSVNPESTALAVTILDVLLNKSAEKYGREAPLIRLRDYRRKVTTGHTSSAN